MQSNEKKKKKNTGERRKKCVLAAGVTGGATAEQEFCLKIYVEGAKVRLSAASGKILQHQLSIFSIQLLKHEVPFDAESQIYVCIIYVHIYIFIYEAW